MRPIKHHKLKQAASMSRMLKEQDAVVAGKTKSSDNYLALILQEQYDFTESFCNATTAIHNALMQSGSSNSNNTESGRHFKLYLHLDQAIQEYQCALDSVHANLRLLESLTITNSIHHDNDSIKSGSDDDQDQEIESRTNATDPSTAMPLKMPRRRSVFYKDPLKQSLHAHVERTRRILTTIYQSGQGASFHANGLPTTTRIATSSIPAAASSDSTGNAIRLVSLAALRASIQTVMEYLQLE